MSTSDLEKTLEAYAESLEALEKADSSPSLESCLNVLVARDEIQKLLSEKSPAASKALPRLSALDDRIKQQSKVIAREVPLEKWREIIKPPSSAWWWYLKTPKPFRFWYDLDWLWDTLTVPIHAVNLALVVSISVRFLAGGPDAIGALAVIGQSAIAMFAAGAPLTKAGQQFIGRFLKATRVPKWLWHEVNLAIAISIFLGLLVLHNSLPGIARFYIRLGDDARDAQQTTDALLKYRRAIELDPNSMEAHFRLGGIYEDLLEIDQARSEYRVAMLSGCIEAYNNLARLFIVHDQNYDAAAVLLKQGQSQIENRDKLELTHCSQTAQENLKALEYSFFTNLGWARLMQERWDDAEGQLREAIKISDQGAAPHCLLAQVLEQKKDEEQSVALAEWVKCFDYARTPNPDEDQWLGIAQQRLSEAEL